MKTKKVNRFDALVSKLIENYSAIPDYDLLINDPRGKSINRMIISKFSEINDFKLLYKNHLVPAVNKAVSETKTEFLKSNYRKSFELVEPYFQDNYFDIIRFGYVGLFHKMENYLNELIKQANNFFLSENDPITLETYYKTKYNYDFSKWKFDILANKINWISNCTKHYDGYPLKKPVPESCCHYPIDKKINIRHDEFFTEVDFVAKDYYILKLKQVFAFGSFKMAYPLGEQEFLTSELKERFTNIEKQIIVLMKL